MSLAINSKNKKRVSIVLWPVNYSTQATNCAMDLEHGITALREWLHQREVKRRGGGVNSSRVAANSPAPWAWVMRFVMEMMEEYPSGVTETVLLAELERKWEDARIRIGSGDKIGGSIEAWMPEKQIPRTAVFDVTVQSVREISNTGFYLFIFADSDSADDPRRSVVEMYVHERFDFLIQQRYPTFFRQRRVRVTDVRFDQDFMTRSAVNSTNLSADGRRRPAVRMLATPHMVFVLDAAKDAEWLDAEAGDLVAGFEMRGNDADFGILVKLCGTEENGVDRATKYVRIWVADMRDRHKSISTLVLWDDQMRLNELWKKGDVLAIKQPLVSRNQAGALDIQIGSTTAVLCIPSKPAEEKIVGTAADPGTGSSQYSVPRDDEGVLDLATFPERMYVADLKPNMTNVSLLGFVTFIASNDRPDELVRFGIRLADATGSCDVTLWDAVGSRAVQNIEVGQLVFMYYLSTSALKERGTFYTMGSTELGTKIYNVSTNRGLLSSLLFAWPQPLSKSLPAEFPAQMYVRGVVSGWFAASQDNTVTVIAHAGCKRLLEIVPEDIETWYYCPFCLTAVDVDTEYLLTIGLVVDDGTGSVVTHRMNPVAGRNLIGMMPESFHNMDITQKVTRLNELIGKEFLFSLSLGSSDETDDYVRVDALVPYSGIIRSEFRWTVAELCAELDEATAVIRQRNP
ncbi:hypothetical protein BJ742DRAFT_794038 [Cladochytrium replicatum]|nr:hypothetical protein BJ742DRAFT_794038 [Cladochytrium replicatum]